MLDNKREAELLTLTMRNSHRSPATVWSHLKHLVLQPPAKWNKVRNSPVANRVSDDITN